MVTNRRSKIRTDKKIEDFPPQTLTAYNLQAKAESSNDLKPSSLSHCIRFIRSLFRFYTRRELLKQILLVK